MEGAGTAGQVVQQPATTCVLFYSQLLHVCCAGSTSSATASYYVYCAGSTYLQLAPLPPVLVVWQHI